MFFQGLLLLVCSSKTFCRPKVEAHAAVDVRILCDDVFCAVILLAAPGMPEPQRIAVYSMEERVSPTKDGWGHSSSIVFR